MNHRLIPHNPLTFDILPATKTINNNPMAADKLAGSGRMIGDGHIISIEILIGKLFWPGT